MADIVLTTLNARWSHTAFGLRYLYANLGDLKPRAEILEFEISRAPLDVVTALLDANPKIIGFGVYIWNVRPLTDVLALLRRLRPDIRLVIGGPEVSYEYEQQPIFDLCDYLITGEADLQFAELARDVLEGRPPASKVIEATVPELAQVALPYEAYTDTDIARRVIYVEASRGCPFSCEFCLSALEIPVRTLALERLLPALDQLLDRGATTFKFVDRTFNLNIAFAEAILQFFLKRMRPNLFLHFEMIPDRLPEALRKPIAQFPAGVCNSRWACRP